MLVWCERKILLIVWRSSQQNRVYRRIILWLLDDLSFANKLLIVCTSKYQFHVNYKHRPVFDDWPGKMVDYKYLYKVFQLLCIASHSTNPPCVDVQTYATVPRLQGGQQESICVHLALFRSTPVATCCIVQHFNSGRY